MLMDYYLWYMHYAYLQNTDTLIVVKKQIIYLNVANCVKITNISKHLFWAKLQFHFFPWGLLYM